jgi:outer membrane protein, heavy metal efflux system
MNLSKVLFTVLVFRAYAGAQSWTEESLLNLFDQQNPMRREAQAAAASAVEAIRLRTLWPNPFATYIRETVGFNEFAQAEQQFPISGRLKLTQQALEPARESAEAQGAARIWDTRSSLRVAFYRALAAEQSASALRAGLATIDSIVNLLRIREQEGEGSLYDRIRVERETADIRADLALALARSRSERSVVSSYVPSSTVIAALEGDLAPRRVPAAKEEIIRLALERRAEIRSETTQMARLSFEQKAADRSRIPEPIVTAGFKRTQVAPGQNDKGAVIAVLVPLPLFNKGQTEVARLAAEQTRAEARRDLLAQQISAAVSGAYDVYAARMDALNAFDRETREIGENLLKITRTGYEEGELGILQLLDSYRVQRQTNIRRLELQLSVKEIEIELSRAAGYDVTQ